MDYFSAFEISKSGLVVEKLRMDIVALNIANSNSVVTNPANVYKPMRVITGSKLNSSAFKTFESYLTNQQMGVEVLSVEEMPGSIKQIYDPKNPYADIDGYTYRPAINPASEMIEMIKSLRAYQANIKAISAAKAMADEALRIGSK